MIHPIVQGLIDLRSGINQMIGQKLVLGMDGDEREWKEGRNWFAELASADMYVCSCVSAMCDWQSKAMEALDKGADAEARKQASVALINMVTAEEQFIKAISEMVALCQAGLVKIEPKTAPEGTN